MYPTMMKPLAFTYLTAATLLAVGCANISETSAPSAEGLRAKTAGILGFAPSMVAISDLRDGGGITYYVAKAPNGTYGCSIPSGGMTAFATLGMVNLQPSCAKQ